MHRFNFVSVCIVNYGFPEVYERYARAGGLVAGDVVLNRYLSLYLCGYAFFRLMRIYNIFKSRSFENYADLHLSGRDLLFHVLYRKNKTENLTQATLIIIISIQGVAFLPAYFLYNFILTFYLLTIIYDLVLYLYYRRLELMKWALIFYLLASIVIISYFYSNFSGLLYYTPVEYILAALGGEFLAFLCFSIVVVDCYIRYITTAAYNIIAFRN